MAIFIYSFASLEYKLMFTLSDLKRYLAYCKNQLAETSQDAEKRFYTKAIIKTENDIKALLAKQDDKYSAAN